MAVLRLDCVGTSDTVDLTLVCNEVCKHIQHLRQLLKDKYGQFVQNSPDKKICHYMSLKSDLHDDTTGWTMQLGHSFFAALDEHIQDIISDRLYTLPILSGRPNNK